MKKKPALSPFAPQTFPVLAHLDSLGVAALSAGLKKRGALDLALFTLPEHAQIAAITTTSDCPSAAVQWCKRILPNPPRAIIINAGNANAFTFQQGQRAVQAIAHALADKLSIPSDSIYMASTGVIGVPLAEQQIIDSLDALCRAANTSESHHWHDAAQAITTTDTYAKGASSSYVIDGLTVNLVGIAKGSGMIAPNMATMLAFLFTDAQIPQAHLQRLLSLHAETTFNAITVDSDMSTSDTVMLTALNQCAPYHRAALASVLASPTPSHERPCYPNRQRRRRGKKIRHRACNPRQRPDNGKSGCFEYRAISARQNGYRR